MTIAIIGAGMAGLSAATALKQAGLEVTVFDKGRGPGGRMSSRRAESAIGALRFDHGAQFFTAREPDFIAQVEDWLMKGVVAKWDARFAHIGADGSLVPAKYNHPRYVGTPSMNTVIRHMAKPHDVSWNTRITGLSSLSSGWQLCFDKNTQTEFEAVILAVPAEQALDLLETVSSEMCSKISAAISEPCWSVMLGFEQPVGLSWDAAHIDGQALSWAARNSSKPGRDKPETWVLHASPEWSRVHLECESEEIIAKIQIEAAQLGLSQKPVHAAAHRWRYSQVFNSLKTAAIWDPDLRLGVCGDFCLGGKVEAAWSSGSELSKIII
ncbi:MAG: NAD(P)-binding protein [Henriciella sp.]